MRNSDTSPVVFRDDFSSLHTAPGATLPANPAPTQEELDGTGFYRTLFRCFHQWLGDRPEAKFWRIGGYMEADLTTERYFEFAALFGDFLVSVDCCGLAKFFDIDPMGVIVAGYFEHATQ